MSMLNKSNSIQFNVSVTAITSNVKSNDDNTLFRLLKFADILLALKWIMENVEAACTFDTILSLNSSSV